MGKRPKRQELVYRLAQRARWKAGSRNPLLIESIDETGTIFPETWLTA